jgi:Fur family ferric uptake transcriptional regulator
MKQDIEKHIREMLKSAGLYYTENRVSILKVLFKSGKPLSEKKIATMSGERHFDKVTIYRTLESLAKAGLVHKAFINKRASHFELAHRCTERQCHPHFTCTNCGSTHCLTDISLPMATTRHKGFIINRQQVHLEGLCPACS